MSIKKNNSAYLKFFILISVFLIFLATSLSGLVFYYYSSDLPDLKDITSYKPSLVNEIYSSDGRLIGQFGIEKRKLVGLNDIPSFVTKTFIAIEDKRFFEHSGLDFRGILRAFIQNVREGDIVAGGSTITQQVTKNLVLSPEKTFSRKIKEAILSYRIEKNLSKQEILFLYLNHIYLADGTYGIEAASNNYFGKQASELNLAEAALLAGIPKRPEYFSPRRNPERAFKRQKLVLKIMKNEGLITSEQFEKAYTQEVKIRPKHDVNFQIAPYFIEFVRQYLEKKVGEEAYRAGGYRVITTVDIDASLAAHWAVRNGIYDYESRWGNNFVIYNVGNDEGIKDFIRDKKVKELKPGDIHRAVVSSLNKTEKGIDAVALSFGNYKVDFKYLLAGSQSALKNIEFPFSDKYPPLNGYNDIYVIPKLLKRGDVIKVKVLEVSGDHVKVSPHFDNTAQAALVSLDTEGNILAMVGGFAFTDSQFNRATQAQRQPGSSFKPLVYSAAIDKGYTETSILFDMPIILKDWEPSNYDGTYLGAIVLREAIANSRNLATVRMLMDVGPVYVANYSNKFKFRSKFKPYPSLALGGADVSLIEMVSAYNVFANGGQWVEPRFILRIYDRNGAIIEDNTGEFFLRNEKMLKEERLRKRKDVLEQIAEETRNVGKSDEFILEKEFKASEEEIDQQSSFLSAEEFVSILRDKSMDIGLGKDPERLISTETSYIVTDLLRAVVSEGTGRMALRLSNLAQVAGKTGTTNDYTDAWFVGYTPKVTTGVWVGKDNHTTLGKREAGSRAALPIWVNYMGEVLKRNEFKGGTFKVPTGIKIVETPYGKIPYRSDSVRDEILNSIRAQIEARNNPGLIKNNEGIKGIGVESSNEVSNEAEIDFLLRR